MPQSSAIYLRSSRDVAILVTDFFLFGSKPLTKSKTYDHFPTLSTKHTAYTKRTVVYKTVALKTVDNAKHLRVKQLQAESGS